MYTYSTSSRFSKPKSSKFDLCYLLDYFSGPGGPKVSKEINNSFNQGQNPHSTFPIKPSTTNNFHSSKSLTRSFLGNQGTCSSTTTRICQKCLYNKLKSKEDESFDQVKLNQAKMNELARDLKVVFDCSMFEFFK